jgi:anti-sigma regulatory factor (Ser/Thr protein kinase)
VTEMRTVDQAARFRHEAFLYEGQRGFMNGALPFIREGVRAEEPVMVVVAPEKIDWLRDALGDDAGWVEFEDTEQAGRNPARLIALWRSFVDSHDDAQALRGIGEPAGPDRDAEAFDECRRHESLLNLAFDDDRDFWLLCPYDTAALPSGVVDGARATHPLVAHDGPGEASPTFDAGAGALAGPLSRPPSDAAELSFEAHQLREVRHFVEVEARAIGLPDVRVGDLVFSAGELVSNSIRHGGGRGVARVWREGTDAVLEVRDAGLVEDPLIGRIHPRVDQVAGRGVWLVNQLCDLVQVRSGTGGTVVRVRIGGLPAPVARRAARTPDEANA